MQCGGPKSFPILNHNAGYMNFGSFGICWLIWSQSGHKSSAEAGTRGAWTVVGHTIISHEHTQPILDFLMYPKVLKYWDT